MDRLLQNSKHLLVLLFVGVLSISTANAFDFSKTCSTGQTLYYEITDASNKYVRLVRPSYNWSGYTKPTGNNIALPSTIIYNSTTYTVKEIAPEACMY